MKIVDVEGIGPTYAAKLQKAGLQTTDDLLKMGGKPKGRQELEKATGISAAKILEWANHVDLYRIETERAIFDLGLEEILEGDGITLIEWADRMESLLPPRRIEIACSFGSGEDDRVIEVTMHEPDSRAGLVSTTSAKRR